MNLLSDTPDPWLGRKVICQITQQRAIVTAILQWHEGMQSQVVAISWAGYQNMVTSTYRFATELLVVND